MFTVWCPDLGECHEDGMKINAMFPDSAAAEWARRYDWNSAEYSIVGGTDKTVNVMGLCGKIQVYIVSGEAVPSYSARLAQENHA